MDDLYILSCSVICRKSILILTTLCLPSPSQSLASPEATSRPLAVYIDLGKHFLDKLNHKGRTFDSSIPPH